MAAILNSPTLAIAQPFEDLTILIPDIKIPSLPPSFPPPSLSLSSDLSQVKSYPFKQFFFALKSQH